MWPTRDETRTVSCIACGKRLTRSKAREYDKYGNRWDRDGKSFEYLCKPCYRDLSNHSRDGLEDVLESTGAGTVSREEFLRRYVDAVDTERGERAGRE